MADGLEPVLEGVRGAGLREKTARTLKVMAVALHPGLLETVRDALALDDAQRNIRTGLAGLLHLTDPVTDFIQHGSFVQTFPGGDQTHRGDAVPVRLLRRFRDRFGVHKAIFR